MFRLDDGSYVLKDLESSDATIAQEASDAAIAKEASKDTSCQVSGIFEKKFGKTTRTKLIFLGSWVSFKLYFFIWMPHLSFLRAELLYD